MQATLDIGTVSIFELVQGITGWDMVGLLVRRGGSEFV